MAISPEKEQALRQRMESLGVGEEDIQETFIRGSGPGGRKKDKTSSCVRLLHIPSGISIKCQQDRSQGINRFLARRLLLDRLEALRAGGTIDEQDEKIRRNKDRRRRRSQKKVSPTFEIRSD